jgi:hypothetical protein
MATLKRSKRGDATIRSTRKKIAAQLKLPLKAIRLILPSKRRANDSLQLEKLRAKWRD